MGGIIWVIIVGFIAGIIARLLSPGPNNPSGFILTTVLGIAGAFLATFIGQAIGHYGPDQGAGFITATIGALMVLFIWNRLVASRVISDPGISDGRSRHPRARLARSDANSNRGSRDSPMTQCRANSDPRHAAARTQSIGGTECTELSSATLRDAATVTESDASPHPSAHIRRSCCSTPARPGSTPAARCRRPMRRPSAAPSPPRNRAPPWRRPRRGPW